MNTGQVVWTRGIMNKVAADTGFAYFISDSLKRYLHQDWGDISEEDKLSNAKALAEGTRILAAYKNGLDKIWIITEADRSSTCILFPEEY
jgi:hypothetical protein